MVSAPPAGRVITRSAPRLGVQRDPAAAAGPVVVDPQVEKLIAEEQ